MGQSLALNDIHRFLDRLSEQYTQPIKIYLLGGSALCFLGSPRRTVDIDFTLEASSEALEMMVKIVAQELQLEVEIIPLEEFIPLPDESATRHQTVGSFGSIEVLIFDPYSIALSKLARGFDTDIQDVLFLLERNIIALDKLIRFVEEALPEAWDYDIDPNDMKKYMGVVKNIYR